jgi:IS30 family transposase
MGRSYDQLSLDDRCEISRLSANGSSIRQIAAALDRSPSTISRELKRNSGAQVGYRSSYANQQSRARRWKGMRLERDERLRAAVLERLASGWSPEQIAGRLARDQGRKVICHETIYRFIYAQLARTRDYRWRRYLPRGKSRRGCRGRRGGSPASFIEGRVSVAKRPPEANDRKTCGHWEADLMMFAKYGQAILTVHDRKSRLLLATRLASKAANGVASHLVDLFGAIPQPLRRTVTFDNGTEFVHFPLVPLGREARIILSKRWITESSSATTKCKGPGVVSGPFAFRVEQGCPSPQPSPASGRGGKEKARSFLRAFAFSYSAWKAAALLRNPCRPCRPEAWRGRRRSSSAVRRSSLRW